MGIPESVSTDLKFIEFDSRHSPKTERLASFERFVHRTPMTSMIGTAFEALSLSNENVHLSKRIVAEDIKLCEMTTSGYKLSADKIQEVRRNPPATISFCQIKSGTVEYRTPRETVSLSAGDFYITRAHEAQIEIGPSDITRVIVPDKEPQFPLADDNNLVVVRKHDPIAEIATATIRSLKTAMSTGQRRPLRQTSVIASGFVHSLFASNSLSVRMSRYDLIRESARNFIQQNIHEHDLDVASLANYVNASRATLYRALEPDGGVRQLILSMRLKYARQLLRSQRTTRGIVEDISYRCGFKTADQFSKAYKARYQVTPSDYVRLRRSIDRGFRL